MAGTDGEDGDEGDFGALGAWGDEGTDGSPGSSSGVYTPVERPHCDLIVDCPPGQMNWETCTCGESPIVLDVLGNGFRLTSKNGGVLFDLGCLGVPRQTSWTAADSDDVWLVLDRNGNGLIDDGSELFGNFNDQPNPPIGQEKNGFLALAVFDKYEEGGNADGMISSKDSAFRRLRLWRDSNQNGVSEASELFRLSDLGVRTIHLNYHRSDRVDEHGNQFRYRARVLDARDSQLGRWAWDFWLVSD